MKNVQRNELTEVEREDFENSIRELTGTLRYRVDKQVATAYHGRHLSPDRVRNLNDAIQSAIEALEALDFALPFPLPKAAKKPRSSTVKRKLAAA